ncbi:hypothetical protein HMPREF1860_00509 [Prevotella amnii]|uniref:Uncharacterized protein n=1 Tax=Prevotella amnii TaxID=419005 RepID=A0A134BIX4_9BACT|nr:hypothetical protein HMPREF1860_00509 [Prevotella amnii]
MLIFFLLISILITIFAKYTIIFSKYKDTIKMPKTTLNKGFFYFLTQLISVLSQ